MKIATSKSRFLKAAAVAQREGFNWLAYRHFVRLPDGSYVPLKRAYARFTGVSLIQFHTHEARDHVGRFGIKVVRLTTRRIRRLAAST